MKIGRDLSGAIRVLDILEAIDIIEECIIQDLLDERIVKVDHFGALVIFKNSDVKTLDVLFHDIPTFVTYIGKFAVYFCPSYYLRKKLDQKRQFFLKPKKALTKKKDVDTKTKTD